MRKDRLYLYTFLAITILFVLIGGVAAKYFVQLSAEQMLDTKLMSSKREAKEVALLVGSLFEAEISKEKIREQVQQSIQNTHNGTSFVSIMDWSGNRVCYPDITLVGTSISKETSEGFTMNSEINPSDFYELITNNPTSNQKEILSLTPVPNSDWIVAAYANTGKIASRLKNIRNRFYTIFSIMGFVIVLSSVITVRLIGSLYEKQLERKNEALETEVIGLAKLNSDLGEYQKRVSENLSMQRQLDSQQRTKEKTTAKETGKKRILTYLRNELLSIAIEEIAYIYTENTITYVVDFNGKKSTTNSSLDELYSGLDSSFFYRANRQFIIAISAIEKIIRYGNNQLKIVVSPNSEVDIIIGKNKAAEFKQWLNL
ncbi:LytTR family transcriptional regulator [Muricauda sp. SCSIO 64092]|uniref:LytR/AlgR family response regulator transcription factor n=1 Tax=Allomuricauda sp. SCSIO 64092 TaxID=2908842 RepID=UPI001FF2A9E1|nr:LytTR family DNA-binding domain-containing protein [Muricauda sp. SCSIO 64092]UOY07466.1 LytTR family transcriptional regulator [Muricauda sp. SCSIO 64092]